MKDTILDRAEVRKFSDYNDKSVENRRAEDRPWGNNGSQVQYTQPFIAAIASAGLTPPKTIVPDGVIHRFATNGKRDDDGGWYSYHEGIIPWGVFGNWRSDLKEYWRADIGRSLTPEEEAAHRAAMDAAECEHKAEGAQRHADAREKAAKIWAAASPAPDSHEYLKRKGVKSYGLRVNHTTRRDIPYSQLIIPMRDGTELHSLQYIPQDEGDKKRFLPGGRKKGCYFSIGAMVNGVLCITEGYATGASIHEATGYPVAVAFDAGNLLPVAKAIRDRYPDLRLILCADDDAKTQTNPGLTKAKEAALAVDGRVAVPDFGEARPAGATDFNDMHRHRGLEVVRACITNGEKPGAKATGKVPAIVTITADVLGSMDFPPTKWAVPGILPAGVALLAGKPKTGKSWMALDMALAVAGGGPALGALQCEHGLVLYVAGEDSKKRLAKRLNILCPNESRPKHLHLATEILKLGQGGEEQIRAWLDVHPDARLIIIDTLAKLRAAPKRTDTLYSADYDVGQALTAISGEYDVTILIVAHTRKMKADDPLDLVSGTLGLTGGVDGVLVLQREPVSDNATLYVTGRDIEEQGEHGLAWERNRARWTLTGGDPRVVRLGTEQKRVYELLTEAPRNIKELTEVLNPGHVVTDPNSDVRRSACSKLVHKLHDKGLIRPGADGKWTPMPIAKVAGDFF